MSANCMLTRSPDRSVTQSKPSDANNYVESVNRSKKRYEATQRSSQSLPLHTFKAISLVSFGLQIEVALA